MLLASYEGLAGHAILRTSGREASIADPIVCTVELKLFKSVLYNKMLQHKFNDF